MAQPQLTTEHFITDARETETTLFLTRKYNYRKHTVHIENKTQTVILRCDFDGSPKPAEIEWAFNGNTLKKDAYGIRRENVSLEILIPSVYHNGEYKCHACNSVECVYSTTVLKLTFQIEANSMKNISVEEGLGAVFDSLVSVVVYRRMRLNKKYYERLVKIVTVRNEPSYNDYVGFQVPIVSIETRRLLTAVRTRNEPAAVLEYEYDVGLEWEFPREKLTLANQLGAGAFGNVVLAVAEGLLFEGVDTPVAVKMLKDEHTDDDVKDLVCEMEIMKKIGNHPNVVSLLGSCTRNGPLFVIVEYAVHGNLKSFLHDHRSESTTTLTTNQLVSFASQIASGMQHLSSMKLIHRDLAARNILVSEGFVMKIADFGLARDVHNQEYYRKMTSGKLPMRWMAPESLEERFFNTKSDVWSFGVLQWEIMTLGRDPHPFVADWQSFLEYLKQGHRLEQPTNCPDEIYQLMEACWEFNPENRPTFEQISAVFENIRLANTLDVELMPRLNYAIIMPATAV
ncbi:fibroblast growth factor receptor homolog 1-like [Culex pipiens pallens]|uniref:fibroblast growth factor receptor homolog 1-like n=1 Tax=Culex pipiens pallens TaxID=42434 RepID=UPI001954A072|nr:fibroblast growth factor receptor homolog 1-like [Culex pipiens pallens]